jgi:enoyl-CoA hydratase/carnithine racemase
LVPVVTWHFSIGPQSHVHEVLAEAAGSARIATLNRPKALNALNTNMCRVLTDYYTKWEKDDNCKVHARAGCLGGGGFFSVCDSRLPMQAHMDWGEIGLVAMTVYALQVIIMRGSGDKAFCAGGDVVSMYLFRLVHAKLSVVL